jgi:putative nucleotidyltransferase with HDIG domain
MPKALKLYIAGLVTLAAFAVLATSLAVSPKPEIGLGGSEAVNVALGIAFWTFITLAASALPIVLPGGSMVAVSMAPVIVAMNLGGPTAAAWVALIGCTEMRELRGRIPWYGTLANHAGIALPAIAGGWVARLLAVGSQDPAIDFIATLVGAAVLFSLNLLLASTLASLRTGRSFGASLLADIPVSSGNFAALAPMAWLMARTYTAIGWWATLLFALPMYMTRMANQASLEMREMFTQTIQSLANAVDKRDPHTAGHSRRVMQIASDIGRVMKCPSKDMEALEWGGLLHDIGKIGVRDEILLKQEKLTKEERTMMNAHPVLGAEIIAPVRRLAPELPIIRHHHEWYNGSGYPDRLLGDEIPRLARILHVADAFEAMTAKRPYRMTPLSHEQAMSELRKFAGIQFDPVVVDAFSRTPWAEGVFDPGRETARRVIPLLSGEGVRVAQMSDAGQADYATSAAATAMTASEGGPLPTASKAG